MRRVLKDNNYPSSFVRRCEDICDKGASSTEREDPSKFLILPYVSGVSEKICRVLRKHDIKVAHKTVNTINDMFPRPLKDRKGKRMLPSVLVWSIKLDAKTVISCITARRNVHSKQDSLSIAVLCARMRLSQRLRNTQTVLGMVWTSIMRE